jgi:beta-galactosidase/beta-glucuronidase
MFGSTFSDYLGPKPSLFRVGIYDDVEIVYPDRGEITGFHTPYVLSGKQDFVSLEAKLEITGGIPDAKAEFTLASPGGSSIGPVLIDTDIAAGRIDAYFQIENPMLWYPRSHGPSHLYTLNVILFHGSAEADRFSRKVGFRSNKESPPQSSGVLKISP